MQGRRIACVYGSVTGKAQSIAELIVDSAVDKGFQIELFSFEHFGKSWSLEGLDVLIIVSSTTGDGEQPEALTKFWRKLRPKTLPPTYLAPLRFCILGLGDTNYNQFCNGPKNLHRRIKELGGREFYAAGWADDGTGLELVVEPWIEGLWSSLTNIVKSDSEPGPDQVKPEPSSSDVHDKMSDTENGVSLKELVISEPTLEYSSALSQIKLDLPTAPARFIDVEFSNEVELSTPPYQNGMKPPLATSSVQTARVVSNVTLSSPGAVKTYMEMELEPEERFDYLPGDSFGIICENRDEDVEKVCRFLGMDSRLQDTCTVSVLKETKKARAKVPEYVPRVCSVERLLKSCLDVRSVPKKLFLRALVEFTGDKGQRRRLEELSSKQGGDEYMKFIREEQLGFIQLLELFPTCKPPLSVLVEHLPRLLPRPYSFSSSPLPESRTIKFVYTVVETPYPGLATSWLRTQKNGDNLQIYPRQSTGFHPPEEPDQNFIMVCAGSGIGPFLGFLEHRRHLNRTEGTACLYFGCRNKDKDFLHKDKLEEFLKDGALSKLRLAFSRDETADGVKYVQDALEQDREEVRKLIMEGAATVYVCGDAKNLGKSVLEKFTSILGSGDGDGAHYVQKMIVDKRYKQDLWTS